MLELKEVTKFYGAKQALDKVSLTLAPGDLPSPGEAVPGGTVTEVNGTEVTAWRLTGDLDRDGRAEGLCHSQFLTGDMWVVLETESRASAGAEEPWEEASPPFCRGKETP